MFMVNFMILLIIYGCSEVSITADDSGEFAGAGQRTSKPGRIPVNSESGTDRGFGDHNIKIVLYSGACVLAGVLLLEDTKRPKQDPQTEIVNT